MCVLLMISTSVMLCISPARLDAQLTKRRRNSNRHPPSQKRNLTFRLAWRLLSNRSWSRPMTADSMSTTISSFAERGRTQNWGE